MEYEKKMTELTQKHANQMSSTKNLHSTEVETLKKQLQDQLQAMASTQLEIK